MREEGEDDREEAEEFGMIVEGMLIDCGRVRLDFLKMSMQYEGDL